jgi:hypothetical protein
LTDNFKAGVPSWIGRARNILLLLSLPSASYLTVNHVWRFYRTRFWSDNTTYQRVMPPIELVLTFVSAAVALTFFRAENVQVAMIGC